MCFCRRRSRCRAGPEPAAADRRWWSRARLLFRLLGSRACCASGMLHSPTGGMRVLPRGSHVGGIRGARPSWRRSKSSRQRVAMPRNCWNVSVMRLLVMVWIRKPSLAFIARIACSVRFLRRCAVANRRFPEPRTRPLEEHLSTTVFCVPACESKTENNPKLVYSQQKKRRTEVGQAKSV